MPRSSRVVVNHYTLSRSRTTKRTGRRSLPSTMLRPQIHLLRWTRRAAEAKALGSRFPEARRRRTNSRYIYTHIRTSFRPFLGSIAKRLRENRNRKVLSISLDFQWTYETMPPVCNQNPDPSAVVLVGPCCRHAGSRSKESVHPRGPGHSHGKRNPSDDSITSPYNVGLFRSHNHATRDWRFLEGPLSYFPVCDKKRTRNKEEK